MNRLQFVSYLRNTLIPDFREADMHATAEDFETALQFIAEDAARIDDLERALAALTDTTNPFCPADHPAFQEARNLLKP